MSQTLTYTIGQDRRTLVDDIQNFSIDFNDQGVKNWVQARQYERSMRQVFVNIKNEDGTPFDLTGCNVWFEGFLPKNAKGDFRVIDDKGYVALDPSAGRFRFDMPGHAFTVAGSYRQAFFRIVKDGNSVTTLEFDLEVLADKVIDGLVPRTYISPVEELIDEIETKYQDSTDKLTKMTSEFIDKFTQSMNTLKALGVTVQNGLDALDAKIKQDNLFTQAEAEAFKKEVEKQLEDYANQIKQQQDDFMDRLNEQLASDAREVQIISEDEWIAPLPANMAAMWAGVVNNVPHGDHIFNFGLLSDNHFQLDGAYAYHSLDHYIWFGEATKRAKVDAVVINGDNINGDNYELTYAEANRQTLIKSYLTVRDVLEGSIGATTPAFWIKGNHDNGCMFHNGVNGPASTLSDEELQQFLHCRRPLYGEVRDNGSLYFYKDFPDKKIRLIGLNTLDDTDEVNTDGSWKTKGINSHKIRQPQLEWLVNNALRVSNDYHVIFCFHTPLNNTIGSEAELQNSDALLQIIKCFKAGSATTINTSGDYPINSLNVDFTQQGKGTVVGIFNGHLHYDASNTTALDGTPIIEQTCSMIHAANKVTRAKDSVNEDAWDLVSVDTQNRTIHMYRFGDGADQSFNY